jgi:hypothetical protein
MQSRPRTLSAQRPLVIRATLIAVACAGCAVIAYQVSAARLPDHGCMHPCMQEERLTALSVLDEVRQLQGFKQLLQLTYLPHGGVQIPEWSTLQLQWPQQQEGQPPETHTIAASRDRGVPRLAAETVVKVTDEAQEADRVQQQPSSQDEQCDWPRGGRRCCGTLRTPGAAHGWREDESDHCFPGESQLCRMECTLIAEGPRTEQLRPGGRAA